MFTFLLASSTISIWSLHGNVSLPPPPPCSNLLRPSGIRLVPGTLTLRMFRGEDLPQMDAGYFEGIKQFLHVGTVQKELVDPYCTASFAGHKGKTKVIWNEQDPEWNTQINLPIRVGVHMCLNLLHPPHSHAYTHERDEFTYVTLTIWQNIYFLCLKMMIHHLHYC